MVNLPGFHAGSGVSRVLWRRDSGFSCRCGWLISSFELDWCDHAKRGVPSLTIVEDLEVVEDGVRQLDSCAPTLPVEEFDLHPAPERLDEGIVVAVPRSNPSTATARKSRKLSNWAPSSRRSFVIKSRFALSRKRSTVV